MFDEEELTEVLDEEEELLEELDENERELDVLTWLMGKSLPISEEISWI